MKLQCGVKLIAEPGNGRTIYINGGVDLCSVNIPGKKSLKYASNSYKPKHDWRALTLEESQMLFTTPENRPDYSSSILLKQLPENLISLLKEMKISKCKEYIDILNRLEKCSMVLKKFQEKMKEILFDYGIKNTSPEFHKIVFNPPDIETLTYYIEEDKLTFVGLHIDRSTAFDFTNVALSKNRLCINIGAENRILYINNLTLNQILELLKKKGGIDLSKVTINNIAGVFFKEFPDYPVIKIVQAPFDFYIAPTDNILHDGSSLNKKYHDICLVWLGYFNTYVIKNERDK